MYKFHESGVHRGSQSNLAQCIGVDGDCARIYRFHLRNFHADAEAAGLAVDTEEGDREGEGVAVSRKPGIRNQRSATEVQGVFFGCLVRDRHKRRLPTAVLTHLFGGEMECITSDEFVTLMFHEACNSGRASEED